MKHLLTNTLVAAVVLFSALTCRAFSGGSGTEADPYIITTAGDMDEIPDGTTDYYRLDADIKAYAPKTNQKFCGHFDGAGHSVAFNVQNESFGADNYGLFSECFGAVVENLTLMGAISLTTRYNYHYDYGSYQSRWYYLVRVRLGSVCGSATSTTFRNIHNKAYLSVSIYQSSSGYFGSDCGLGGLAGIAKTCTFEQCSNVGTLNGMFGKTSSGYPSNAGLTVLDTGVGGLVGIDYNSTISDCYAQCETVSTGFTGVWTAALVGLTNSSHLSNCYFNGITDFAFVWSNYSAATTLSNCISRATNRSNCVEAKYTNCYASLSEPCTTPIEGLFYVESDVLSLQQWYSENLPSWDFNNVWYMPSGESAMPLLRTTPAIEWTGSAQYGNSVEITSTNSYADLIIDSPEEDAVAIEGNRITFLKTGQVSVKVTQDAVIPYKSISRTLTFNVEKAPLIISAKDVSMLYGDEPSDEDVLKYAGFVGSDTPESLDKLPSVVFGGSASSDVGKYNILVSGAASSNYSISYKKGVQTINPRPITVTPLDATRKYGSANPQFKLKYEGWVNGQTESLITEYPTADTQANIRSSAGTYSIGARGGSVHSNYTFSYGTATLTVEKAPLSIGVVDVKRAMNEFNPEFTLTFNGFKNGDDESSLDVLPSVSCEATYDSPVGAYPIVLEGGTDRNYLYELRNGTLVVEPISGVDSIFGEAEDDGARYFTLDGIEVTLSSGRRLSPGIYIRVRNKEAMRIIVR